MIKELKCLDLYGEYYKCENRDIEQYEFTFDFYDDKQYRELVEEKKKDDISITVIGNVNIEQSRLDGEKLSEFMMDSDDETLVLKTNILSFDKFGEPYDYEQLDSHFEIHESDDSVKTFGYVRVGKYEYVRVEDTGLLAILVPLVITKKPRKNYVKWISLIGCLALSLGLWCINRDVDDNVQKENNSHLGIEDSGKDWGGNIQQDFKGENGMDYFETVGAISQTINSENRTVQIVNTGRYGKYLCSVTISLCGEVIDGMETLYDEAVTVHETKPILPAKAVDWDLYDDLSSKLENGIYMFRFLYRIYDIETDGDGNIYAGNLVGEIPVEYSRVTLIK